jgi:coenzyme Q-binding protein COQ10
MLTSKILRNITVSSSGKDVTYKISRSVPCKMSKFVEIVKDVNKYSQFLPFCAKSEVSPYRSRNMQEHAMGTLHIGWGSITDKYTSRVIYDAEKTKITAINLDGHVFEQMRSTWTFKDGTKFVPGEGMVFSTNYDFEIKFKMGNPIYNQAAKAAFPRVSKQMYEAFESRVQELEKK